MKYFTLGETTIFSSSKSAFDFIKDNAVPIADTAIFAFPSERETLNLLDEISGETRSIATLCAISKAVNGCTVSGAYLRYGSIRRISAVVCYKGSLVDIADCTTALPPFSPSGSVKIYRNNLSRFALVVSSDARAPFIWKKLKGRCDFVVALEPDYSQEKENRLRAISDEFSLPFVCVSNSRCFSSNSPYQN